MNRFEYSENVRSMKAASHRDPIDAALYALASLNQKDREAAITRFNTVFKDVTSVPELHWGKS